MRGKNRNGEDRWRVIEWHQFNGGGWSWRIFRDDNGIPLDFETREECEAALRALRAAKVPGKFRLHHGPFHMRAVVAQGHRIRPPKDMSEYIRALTRAS